MKKSYKYVCLMLFVALQSCETDPNRVLSKLGIPTPRLIRIQGGKYEMGSDSLAEASPVHRAAVNEFWMGETEVTVEQFQAFVAETGYITEPETLGGGWIRDSAGFTKKSDASWKNPYFALVNAQPVVFVTRRDAEAYCIWLSRRSGLAIHLPSEVKWEYACRGGQRIEFVNGWTAENSGMRIHDVAQKAPNHFGLYDIQGNVWEWTADDYANYTKESVADSARRNDGSRGAVMRGGSYAFPVSFASVFFRQPGHGAIARAQDLGFRVVISPE